ncbi:SWI5-dependent HO expression protein 3 [Scheffersomyces amazonensis]|uniref:SWI5-dependent HO expression protein 3 n=1 Tax=Scheffersomyces amazonensis TaxID=1078765 RepID=UPI00315D5B0D
MSASNSPIKIRGEHPQNGSTSSSTTNTSRSNSTSHTPNNNNNNNNNNSNNSNNNNNNTSKVIDSLHSQIDSLKEQLETVQLSCDDYRKKYTVVSQKNESYLDQLANSKHEGDMINALLKRKERRIIDLENQINELYSNNETLTLTNKNLKIRCDNLQDSSLSSIAEYERMKISYDALVAAQAEYKRHYQQEISQISDQFEQYKHDQQQRLEELQLKFANNDKDVDTLLDSLTNKRKAMDSIYIKKNKMVLELLFNLSKVAKLHGQDSMQILKQSVETVQFLVDKYPDLPERLSPIEEMDINLEELLNESHETLSNCSFDDDISETSSISNQAEIDVNEEEKSNSMPASRNTSGGTVQRSNTLQNRKRKNKRNSIRFDSKGAPDLSNIVTPTNNNQNQFVLPKRPTNNSNSNQSNQPTHYNNNSNNHTNTHNRNLSVNSNSSRQSSVSYQTTYDSNTFQITQHRLNSSGHTNNNNKGGYRNSSSHNNNNNYNNNNNNTNNTNHNHNNNHNNSNNNNSNGGGTSKQAKRRSMYNNSNNKRNSQLFDATNLNYPLNSN